MGGPNTKGISGLTGQQQQLFGQETAASAATGQQMESILQPLIQEYTQQQALQAPALQFYSGLASGDPSKVATAAAPQLAQIGQQFSGAKQAIKDTTPKGAGQDFALEMLPVQQAGATANLLGSEVAGANNTLLNIGQGAQSSLGNIASGLGGYSMQQLGAGLTAGGQAQTGYKDVMEAQAQQKATTMGFLGSLAGAAGSAAGGGVFGHL